jgi:hypothetical protein
VQALPDADVAVLNLPAPQRATRLQYVVQGLVFLPAAALGSEESAEIRALLGRVLVEHGMAAAAIAAAPQEFVAGQPIKPPCAHAALSAKNGELVIKAPQLRLGSDPFRNRAVVGAAAVKGSEVRTYVASCGACSHKLQLQLCLARDGALCLCNSVRPLTVNVVDVPLSPSQ